MRVVHVVVPDGIDDPARPSGGNVYDRRVCTGLTSVGWSVHEHAVPGDWPKPDVASSASLADVVQRLPDGSVVLIDGLIASTAPEILVPETDRLRLVVLVHMPLGGRATDARMKEAAVLSAAAAVVTTSDWTRRRLLDLYELPADRVHVAEPGVDYAELATGTKKGDRLLCVAAVTYDKGHDVLLDALATIADLSWDCLCVGSVDRDPGFVDDLRRRAQQLGLSDRLSFSGPRIGSGLESTYASSDLLVLPSRAETYGMVVTEALARGLPVVAADVGGVTQALGRSAAGNRPGLLVPPDDPAALGAALRTWLSDSEVRQHWRGAARERRESLPRWSTTTSVVADVLDRALQPHRVRI